MSLDDVTELDSNCVGRCSWLFDFVLFVLSSTLTLVKIHAQAPLQSLSMSSNSPNSALRVDAEPFIPSYLALTEQQQQVLEDLCCFGTVHPSMRAADNKRTDCNVEEIQCSRGLNQDYSRTQNL